jgi:hypothetical protein
MYFYHIEEIHKKGDILSPFISRNKKFPNHDISLKTLFSLEAFLKSMFPWHDHLVSTYPYKTILVLIGYMHVLICVDLVRIVVW